MDTPFIYDRFVTGRDFVGRKNECNALSNLIAGGENVVIFEPPKTGKKSVIQNTLFNMNIKGKVGSTSYALYNRRTQSDIGNKMTVHNINMYIVCAATLHIL